MRMKEEEKSLNVAIPHFHPGGLKFATVTLSNAAFFFPTLTIRPPLNNVEVKKTAFSN